MKTKQESLNDFLIDTKIVLEKDYAPFFKHISLAEIDDWVKLIISGTNDSTCEIWSDGEEITVITGESHWHIDNYAEPCELDKIYENTLRSLFDLLNGSLSTFSCWVGECSIGGGSFSVGEIEEYSELATGYFEKAEFIHVKAWNEELVKIFL